MDIQAIRKAYNNLATNVGDYVNQTILSVSINVLCFLLCFLVCFIVVHILINLVRAVFRFPVLKHFDWLAGGAFGAVRGYFIVAIIFSILPTILSAMPLELVQNMLDQSAIASLFSGANFLTNLIHTGV